MELDDVIVKVFNKDKRDFYRCCLIRDYELESLESLLITNGGRFMYVGSELHVTIDLRVWRKVWNSFIKFYRI